MVAGAVAISPSREDPDEEGKDDQSRGAGFHGPWGVTATDTTHDEEDTLTDVQKERKGRRERRKRDEAKEERRRGGRKEKRRKERRGRGKKKKKVKGNRKGTEK